MNAPMLIPLLGLTAGIIAGGFGASYGTCIGTLLAACLLYIYLSVKAKDPVKGFRTAGCHHIWIFLAFTGIGIFAHSLDTPYMPEKHTGEYVAATGRITEISYKTSGDIATLEVSGLYRPDGRKENVDNMILIVRSDAIDAAIDDIVVMPVSLSRISDSPNSFSRGYAAYMANKGILWQTRCSGHSIRVLAHDPSFNGTAVRLRDRIEGCIEKCGLAKETRYFLITILLGDKDYLDSDTRALFADAGISHILALSGMHVGIISVVLLWLLFPVNIFGYYRLRLLITVLLLFIYAYLTGWQPSTVRATLMASAVTACIWLERKNSVWNSLLFATTLILLTTPSALHDIGLQMSFLCVASLIFFVEPLNPVRQHEHPRLHKAAGIILTSIAATGGTWCLAAYHFGTVPVMFLIANIIVLPLLPAYLTVAITFMTLHSCGFEISWLGAILDTTYHGLLNFLDWLTLSKTSSVIYTPSLTTLILWIVLTALCAVYLNVQSRRNTIRAACMGAAICFCLSAFFTGGDDPDGYIIQKGIGDISILTRTDGIENMLKMRRYSVSECILAGHHIICLDTDIAESDTTLLPEKADILIISGGCGNSLSEISSMVRPSAVAIHPNVRKAREARLIEEADSLGISCHSIRIDGPFKYVSGPQ